MGGTNHKWDTTLFSSLQNDKTTSNSNLYLHNHVASFILGAIWPESLKINSALNLKQPEKENMQHVTHKQKNKKVFIPQNFVILHAWSQLKHPNSNLNAMPTIHNHNNVVKPL